jgi:hypothetical protein
MEREGSLTCPTQAFTCPWSEPDESSQRPYNFNIILDLRMRLSSEFSSSFSYQNLELIYLFSHTYVAHAPLIVSSFGIVLYCNRKIEMERK